MKQWSRMALVAGLIVVLFAGCGGPAVQPLVFNPAPWQDGEVTGYVVRDANGAELGAAQWTWRRTADGWTQAYELNLAGRIDRGEVVVGDDLSMRSAWREVGGTRFEVLYTTDGITISTTPSTALPSAQDDNGATTAKTLKPVASAIDNDVSLQIQRALPLAAGYATRYTDVIPTTGLTAPVKLSVTAAETITVPAGTFPTWQVELDFGSGKHDAWYGQEAPYPLVKYRNRASGAAFELKSITAGTGGESSAPAPAAAAATGRESQPANAASTPSVPPLNIPLLLTTFLVQMPLMIVFPVILGWWIRRRYGIGWGVFGIGALTFIASQVVHLPLNYALGLLGGGRGVALWPLIPMALVAGLSAGICEEGARWVVLQFLAKKTRGWRAGLQFGAGHGGAEAIIFGVLALVNVVTFIALRSADAATLGLPEATARQMQAGVAAYWSTPATMPLLAGFERLCAIALQVSLAVLVMRAVTRRNPGWLLAAIGLHTAADFWAVWAMQTLGVNWTEAGLVPLALFAAWLIWRLRDPSTALRSAQDEPPAAEPEPAPAPAPTAADLAPRVLSLNELVRRSEASKYE